MTNIRGLDKGSTCGKCGWQRGLICLNPKSRLYEILIGRDQKPCEGYQPKGKTK